MKICVVIPAYNEAQRIGSLVRQIEAFGLDVLIVDDGSTDATSQAASSAGARIIRHEKNRGKGAALVTGFQYALETGYEAVITMDGDGQHLPEDIPKFVELARTQEADVLVGDRMHDPQNMPWLRFRTNRFMSWLISLLARRAIPDSQCGFRLLRRRVIERLNLVTTNYEIESEMLIKAARLGYAISSVPVRSVYRGEKSSINPYLDTLRFFRYLWVELFTKAGKDGV